MTSGARVRNTYATFLQLGNSSPKGELIPHNIRKWHHFPIKVQTVEDGHAEHQLVGGVTAHQGYDV